MRLKSAYPILTLLFLFVSFTHGMPFKAIQRNVPKCQKKKCVATFLSLGVSCGGIPFAPHVLSSYLWCSAMGINMAMNNPTSCAGCKVVFKRHEDAFIRTGIIGTTAFVSFDGVDRMKSLSKKIGEKIFESGIIERPVVPWKKGLNFREIG